MANQREGQGGHGPSEIFLVPLFAPQCSKKGLYLFWWGGVRDLYQDAIPHYLIPLPFITLSKAFITWFMLAVVLNSKIVISLY